MTVAIHQPNYIPWLGYFDKIQKSDIFVFLDDVQYVKGTVANRNYIKGQNGEKVLLSVPVMLSKGAFQRYNEIEIDYSQNWQQKHLNQLKNAYYHAPNFELIYSEFEAILKVKYTCLADLNIDIITWMLEKMDIQTPTLRSSTLSIAVEDKNDRNLTICQHLSATTYLSGKGAQSYNNPEHFNHNGILLKVSDYQPKQYVQSNGPFIENLSSLDYLLSNSQIILIK